LPALFFFKKQKRGVKTPPLQKTDESKSNFVQRPSGSDDNL
jgi:hypothetical protein